MRAGSGAGAWSRSALMCRCVGRPPETRRSPDRARYPGLPARIRRRRRGAPVRHPAHRNLIAGAARAWWPIQSSKLAGPGSPRLGRFDSFAASLKVFPGIRLNLASPRAARARLRDGSTRANLGLVIPPAIPPSIPPSGLSGGWLRRRDREAGCAHVGTPVVSCRVLRARLANVARCRRGAHPGTASVSGL